MVQTPDLSISTALHNLRNLPNRHAVMVDSLDSLCVIYYKKGLGWMSSNYLDNRFYSWKQENCFIQAPMVQSVPAARSDLFLWNKRGRKVCWGRKEEYVTNCDLKMK